MKGIDTILHTRTGDITLTLDLCKYSNMRNALFLAVQDSSIGDLVTHSVSQRLLISEQSRAEQSRAEQSRAEQSRAEQSRTEQSRAEQSTTIALQ